MKRRCGIIRMDHAHTTILQTFYQPLYRLLVTWDSFRRENHGITLAQREMWMCVHHQSMKRCANFALSAGSDSQHFILRQVPQMFGVNDRHLRFEYTGILGRSHHNIQRAPQQSDTTLRRVGRTQHALNPSNIAGKAGDDNPPLQRSN